MTRVVPLRIGRTNGNREDVCELSLERVLKDFSFLRFSLDSIVFPEENPTIARLISQRALFGFILEYQFPCPDGVSPSLKTRVRISAKEYSSTSITFKHKRVVLLKMSPDVVPCWQNSSFLLQLSIQIDTQGKFSTRKLASCRVALSDLLLPPFAISKDFPFVDGAEFEGFSLIRIDLGSKNRNLMEKLTEMRGVETPIMTDGPLPRGVPIRARSRSTGRCRSRSERENSPPTQRRPPSTSSMPARSSSRPLSPHFVRALSDWDMRNSRSSSDTTDDEVFHAIAPAPQGVPIGGRFNPRQSRLGNDVVEVTDVSPRKSVIRLTVHSAYNLPPVFDERGRPQSPNCLISVRGRDGELRSLPMQGTRVVWEWTAQFAVSGERKNVVIKILHADPIRGDMPIGFVSLTLPIRNTVRTDFEVVDLSSSCSQNVMPTLNLSVEQVPDPVPSVFSPRPSRMTQRSSSRSRHSTAATSTQTIDRINGNHSGYRRNVFGDLNSRCETPPVEGTSQEIEQRLRRNLDELQVLMDRIPRR